MRRVVLVAVLATASVQIAVGTWWLALHLSEIPRYGDTNDYLNLARILATDNYRTILYPFLLRVAQQFAGDHFAALVYIVQLGMSFVGLYVIAAAVIDSITLDGTWRAPSFAALIAWTNPLIAHLNLTLMPDSIAASFTLLACAYVVRFIGGTATSLHFAGLTLSCLAVLALSRPEKPYLAVAVGGAGIVTLLWKRRRGPAIALASILLIALTTAAAIREGTTTQTTYSDRPVFDLGNIAFSRAVWPHLESIYPHLSEETRSRVSAETAAVFDQHPNNVYPFLARLRSSSNGLRIERDILWTALQTHSVTILVRAASDFMRYAASPMTFLLEAFGVIQPSVGTSWTISRMTEFHPALTRAYLHIGFFLLCLQFVLVAIPFAWQRGAVRSLSDFLIVIAAAILANAAMFSVFHGMGAHVRYALPTHALVGGTLAALTARSARRAVHSWLSVTPLPVTAPTSRDSSFPAAPPPT